MPNSYAKAIDDYFNSEDFTKDKKAEAKLLGLSETIEIEPTAERKPLTPDMLYAYAKQYAKLERQSFTLRKAGKNDRVVQARSIAEVLANSANKGWFIVSE